jgi:hypothetical protein
MKELFSSSFKKLSNTPGPDKRVIIPLIVECIPRPFHSLSWKLFVVYLSFKTKSFVELAAGRQYTVTRFTRNKEWHDFVNRPGRLNNLNKNQGI